VAQEERGDVVAVLGVHALHALEARHGLQGGEAIADNLLVDGFGETPRPPCRFERQVLRDTAVLAEGPEADETAEKETETEEDDETGPDTSAQDSRRHRCPPHAVPT